jgi:hypothetical protein
MSNTLFPGMETSGVGIAEGEVESFSPDRIVIAGIFSPGEVIQFRAGRRVDVLTETAILDWHDLGPICPNCETLESELNDARDELDDSEEHSSQLETKASELADKLTAAESRIDELQKELAWLKGR